MKISQICDILEGEIICRGDLTDKEVYAACGSDMMSDVIAFVKEQATLLTGLVNPQVIRTALMMDMVCIIFVRSKAPNQEMIDLARENGIVMMSTEKTLYNTCGILYSNGLVGIKEVAK